jgi:hypothetical protein
MGVGARVFGLSSDLLHTTIARLATKVVLTKRRFCGIILPDNILPYNVWPDNALPGNILSSKTLEKPEAFA